MIEVNLVPEGHRSKDSALSAFMDVLAEQSRALLGYVFKGEVFERDGNWGFKEFLVQSKDLGTVEEKKFLSPDDANYVWSPEGMRLNDIVDQEDQTSDDENLRRFSNEQKMFFIENGLDISVEGEYAKLQVPFITGNDELLANELMVPASVAYALREYAGNENWERPMAHLDVEGELISLAVQAGEENNYQLAPELLQTLQTLGVISELPGSGKVLEKLELLVEKPLAIEITLQGGQTQESTPRLQATDQGLNKRATFLEQARALFGYVFMGEVFERDGNWGFKDFRVEDGSYKKFLSSKDQEYLWGTEENPGVIPRGEYIFDRKALPLNETADEPDDDQPPQEDSTQNKSLEDSQDLVETQPLPTPTIIPRDPTYVGDAYVPPSESDTNVPGESRSSMFPATGPERRTRLRTRSPQEREQADALDARVRKRLAQEDTKPQEITIDDIMGGARSLEPEPRCYNIKHGQAYKIRQDPESLGDLDGQIQLTQSQMNLLGYEVGNVAPIRIGQREYLVSVMPRVTAEQVVDAGYAESSLDVYIPGVDQDPVLLGLRSNIIDTESDDFILLQNDLLYPSNMGYKFFDLEILHRTQNKGDPIQ